MADISWEDGEDVAPKQGEDVTWEQGEDVSPVSKPAEGTEKSFPGAGTIKKNPATGKWEVGTVESGHQITGSDLGNPLQDLGKAVEAGGAMVKSAVPFGKHIAAGADTLTSGRPFPEALAAQRAEGEANRPAEFAGTALQAIPLSTIGMGAGLAGQLTGAGLGSGLASAAAESSSGKEDMNLPGAFGAGATDPLAYAGPLAGPLLSGAGKAWNMTKGAFANQALKMAPQEMQATLRSPETQSILAGTADDIQPAYKTLQDTAGAGVQRVGEAGKIAEGGVQEARKITLKNRLDEIKQRKDSILSALKNREMDSLSAKDNLKALADAEESAIKMENQEIATALEDARRLGGEGASANLRGIQSRVRENLKATGEARISHLETAPEMQEPFPEWQDRIVNVENSLEDRLASVGLTDEQKNVLRNEIYSVRRRLNTMPGPVPTRGAYAEEMLALRRGIDERIPWGQMDGKSKSRIQKEIRNVIDTEVKSDAVDVTGKLKEFDAELNHAKRSEGALKSFGVRKDVPIDYESGAVGIKKDTVFPAATKALSPEQEAMVSALERSGAIDAQQASVLRQQYNVAGERAIPADIAARQATVEGRQQGLGGLKSMEKNLGEQVARKAEVGGLAEQRYGDIKNKAKEAASAPITPDEAATPEAQRALKLSQALGEAKAKRGLTPEYVTGGAPAQAKATLEDFRAVVKSDPETARALVNSDPKTAKLLQDFERDGGDLVTLLEESARAQPTSQAGKLLFAMSQIPAIGGAARGIGYLAGVKTGDTAIRFAQTMAKAKNTAKKLGIEDAVIAGLNQADLRQIEAVTDAYGEDDPRTRTLVMRLITKKESK